MGCFAGHPPARMCCARHPMASDRYPRASWRESPHFWPGNDGRLAVVIHTANGGFSASITYLKGRGVSSHFIVSRGGSVAQMVGVDNSAWGNGLDWDDDIYA